jgi:Tfp pilus assembly protein PilF
VARATGGHPSEAAAEHDTAVEIDPAYKDAHKTSVALAQTHYQAGIAFAQAGHPSDAAAEFQTALRFDPDFAEAHNNLGVVLSDMPGKEEEAIAQFREALRLRPEYDDARNNLQSLEERRPPGR